MIGQEDWRDGLTVINTGYSSRGPGFNSPAPTWWLTVGLHFQGTQCLLLTSTDFTDSMHTYGTQNIHTQNKKLEKNTSKS